LVLTPAVLTVVIVEDTVPAVVTKGPLVVAAVVETFTSEKAILMGPTRKTTVTMEVKDTSVRGLMALQTKASMSSDGVP